MGGEQDFFGRAANKTDSGASNWHKRPPLHLLEARIKFASLFFCAEVCVTRRFRFDMGNKHDAIAVNGVRVVEWFVYHGWSR